MAAKNAKIMWPLRIAAAAGPSPRRAVEICVSWADECLRRLRWAGKLTE
jgi:hypothetical protein